jgi:Flp pilus assembly pilin Flp
MIAAFLSVAIISAVDTLGQNVKNTFFDQIAGALP